MNTGLRQVYATALKLPEAQRPTVDASDLILTYYRGRLKMKRLSKTSILLERFGECRHNICSTSTNWCSSRYHCKEMG